MVQPCFHLFLLDGVRHRVREKRRRAFPTGFLYSRLQEMGFQNSRVSSREGEAQFVDELCRANGVDASDGIDLHAFTMIVVGVWTRGMVLCPPHLRGVRHLT